MISERGRGAADATPSQDYNRVDLPIREMDSKVKPLIYSHLILVKIKGNGQCSTLFELVLTETC